MKASTNRKTHTAGSKQTKDYTVNFKIECVKGKP